MSKRLDGRKPGQFRSPFMDTGVVSQARGSAYVEVGSAKIVCSVYGPRPSTEGFSESGRIHCEFRRAPFASAAARAKTVGVTDEEKERSLAMAQALETAVILDRFPKSQMDVHALVLESNDCDDLAMAITCASLALCNAGVEMYDLVSACTVCEVDEKLLLDPTDEEFQRSTNTVNLAYMSSLSEITHIQQYGEMRAETLHEAADLCISGNTQIRALMEQSLLRKFQELAAA
jgi:exosome complex component MTR3